MKPNLHNFDIDLFKPNTRILFQGDSITDGGRGRNEDPNHILGHGYQYILSCKYGAAFPDRNLLFLNRGISGNKVSDLLARWQTDAIDLKPDILSILVGVNDLNHNIPAETFEKSYDQLLAQTFDKLPNVKLILAEPFGFPIGKNKDKWPAYYPELLIRQAIVAKLANKYRAIFVQYQQAFDDAVKRGPYEYWMWDGFHPTYNGHQIMADAWEKAVQEFSR